MTDLKKRTSLLRNPEFRAESDENDNLYLEGYFIRFNEETELYPGVFEEIAPEAVSGSLLNNDIRALFNHQTGTVLGRTGNETLQLNADEKGLHGIIEVNREDAEAMNIYSRIKRGDINACSFGFYPLKEEYTERDDGAMHILVKDLELIEVSPVTFPAYPTTEVAARNKDIEQHRKEQNQKQFKIRKQQLKERLQNG